MLLIKNKLALRYINEIQMLKEKIRNEKLKKSEIVLHAVEQYYVSIIRQTIEKQGKEAIEELVSDKELLRKHLIL